MNISCHLTCHLTCLLPFNKNQIRWLFFILLYISINILQTTKIKPTVEWAWPVTVYFRSHLSLSLKPWSVPVLLVLNWNSTVASPTGIHLYSAGLSSIITFNFNEFHPKDMAKINGSKRTEWKVGTRTSGRSYINCPIFIK